jgi:hypothetical protein
MTVRERRLTRTTKSPDLDRPVIIFDDEADRPSRLGWRLALAVVLLVVAAAGAVSWWANRGGDVVATRPAAQAAASAPVSGRVVVGAPTPLAVTVAAPATVVAGQAARFVVSYADGSGIFSGSIEDWGEVGVGSVKQRACSADALPAASVQGSYVATHKWRVAGSYPVSFAVTTYSCSKGLATQETQNARLTVVVAAR